MFEMSLSTPLLTLEESLEKNLISRGILRKIEALIFALCLDYISETSSTSNLPVSRNGPDDILCIALISDYLRDVSPTALSIFEIETGIKPLNPSADSPRPGDQSGFGSIASASLAHKVMKKGINSATAPLNRNILSLDENTKLHIEQEILSKHSRGVLERNIVKAELGIDEIDKDKECPLLISVIKRARENRIAKATVTNSWLNTLKQQQQQEKEEEEEGKEKGERELDNGFPGSTFSKREKSLKTMKSTSAQPILILNL